MYPASQFMFAQAVTEPPLDYVPTAQLSQPSELLVAPCMLAYFPAGHSMLRHIVVFPPGDYVPAGQTVHPSVSVRAPSKVAW